MARAFVTLGCLSQEVTHPRAWLFRVASNLWLNRVRRTREETGVIPEQAEIPEPRASREAAGTLIVRLSPQERAAVVLKDVFDLTLEEIAEALSTTAGAIKAALHRGRGKLVEPEPDEPPTPERGALDAFCTAFNAGDLDRLTAVLLDTVTVEYPGMHVEYGADAARNGSLTGSLFGHLGDGCGIAPRNRNGLLPSPPRVEVRCHRGEAILLCWFPHESGDAVRSIYRLDTDGDRVARIRVYFHTPDVIAEICRELDVPYRTNGYRWW